MTQLIIEYVSLATPRLWCRLEYSDQAIWAREGSRLIRQVHVKIRIYRPRLIRRVDLYAGIYGIYPTITLLLQLVAKDCIPCNGGAKNCTTALTPNLPTVIKLEMWTLCYNSLELLFKAGLQKRLLVIGFRPYYGFFFRASISNVATIDAQTLRD